MFNPIIPGSGNIVVDNQDRADESEPEFCLLCGGEVEDYQRYCESCLYDGGE